MGAGFGGVAVAAELLRHGPHDVTLLEAAEQLGGTWHHNRYPGAACDVPSHLYSYSFAQRASWSRVYSHQPEILAYLRETADDLGITRRIVTGTEVTACAWDEGTREWTVRSRRTGDGDGPEEERTADAVVLATGQLDKPSWPAMEGDFAGAQLPLGALGPRVRPAGEAGRGHRYGLDHLLVLVPHPGRPQRRQLAGLHGRVRGPHSLPGPFGVPTDSPLRTSQEGCPAGSVGTRLPGRMSGVMGGRAGGWSVRVSMWTPSGLVRYFASSFGW